MIFGPVPQAGKEPYLFKNMINGSSKPKTYYSDDAEVHRSIIESFFRDSLSQNDNHIKCIKSKYYFVTDTYINQVKANILAPWLESRIKKLRYTGFDDYFASKKTRDLSTNAKLNDLKMVVTPSMTNFGSCNSLNWAFNYTPIPSESKVADGTSDCFDWFNFYDDEFPIFVIPYAGVKVTNEFVSYFQSIVNTYHYYCNGGPVGEEITPIANGVNDDMSFSHITILYDKDGTILGDNGDGPGFYLLGFTAYPKEYEGFGQYGYTFCLLSGAKPMKLNVKFAAGNQLSLVDFKPCDVWIPNSCWGDKAPYTTSKNANFAKLRNMTVYDTPSLGSDGYKKEFNITAFYNDQAMIFIDFRNGTLIFAPAHNVVDGSLNNDFLPSTFLGRNVFYRRNASRFYDARTETQAVGEGSEKIPFGYPTFSGCYAKMLDKNAGKINIFAPSFINNGDQRFYGNLPQALQDTGLADSLWTMTACPEDDKYYDNLWTPNIWVPTSSMLPYNEAANSYGKLFGIYDIFLDGFIQLGPNRLASSDIASSLDDMITSNAMIVEQIQMIDELTGEASNEQNLVVSDTNNAQFAVELEAPEEGQIASEALKITNDSQAGVIYNEDTEELLIDYINPNALLDD